MDLMDHRSRPAAEVINKTIDAVNSMHRVTVPWPAGSNTNPVPMAARMITSTNILQSDIIGHHLYPVVYAYKKGALPRPYTLNGEAHHYPAWYSMQCEWRYRQRSFQQHGNCAGGKIQVPDTPWFFDMSSVSESQFTYGAVGRPTQMHRNASAPWIPDGMGGYVHNLCTGADGRTGHYVCNDGFKEGLPYDIDPVNTNEAFAVWPDNHDGPYVLNNDGVIVGRWYDLAGGSPGWIHSPSAGPSAIYEQFPYAEGMPYIVPGWAVTMGNYVGSAGTGLTTYVSVAPDFLKLPEVLKHWENDVTIHSASLKIKVPDLTISTQIYTVTLNEEGELEENEEWTYDDLSSTSMTLLGYRIDGMGNAQYDSIGSTNYIGSPDDDGWYTVDMTELCRLLISDEIKAKGFAGYAFIPTRIMQATGPIDLHGDLRELLFALMPTHTWEYVDGGGDAPDPPFDVIMWPGDYHYLSHAEGSYLTWDHVQTGDVTIDFTYPDDLVGRAPAYHVVE